MFYVTLIIHASTQQRMLESLMAQSHIYSPNLASVDFFLSGCLTNKLKSVVADGPEAVYEETKMFYCRSQKWCFIVQWMGGRGS